MQPFLLSILRLPSGFSLLALLTPAKNLTPWTLGQSLREMRPVFPYLHHHASIQGSVHTSWFGDSVCSMGRSWGRAVWPCPNTVKVLLVLRLCCAYMRLPASPHPLNPARMLTVGPKRATAAPHHPMPWETSESPPCWPRPDLLCALLGFPMRENPRFRRLWRLQHEAAVTLPQELLGEIEPVLD